MKRLLIGAAVLALIVSAVACKKCVTCTYEYQYLDTTKTVTFAEECGKNSDVNAFIADKESEAKRYGAELVCTDTK